MAQNTVNGISTTNLSGFAQKVRNDASSGIVGFAVTTDWEGGTRSLTTVNGWTMAGRKLTKNFEIPADEPPELLGNNTAPNPQELLLAAMNACMTVGYVATAAMMGVEIKSLKIHASGNLDLRGFLGLDDSVKPGYDTLDYEVIIEGNGTPEQFEQIHEIVTKTSPNRWNVANAIQLHSKLTCISAK